ncbi:probable serine/threonine-protein kinase At1g54610 [Solanum verrucosum]|uniref:probable serine/threonine-protein kinase At1g54610 n=1 Tax=Solanum verrucosum TaxID=315347 RepID=UPI0020D1A0FB|nr:probable serine/threonine-protein kinase At1g54610 [Solanum verrucosum]
MGCVVGKGYSFMTPERLERMKNDNGYVKGNGVEKQRRREQQQQQMRDIARIRDQEGNHAELDQEEKRNGNNGVKIGIIDNGRKIGGDDQLVDGWPKWLVDNIPKEVLLGLVPKTADSYEKLDKVGQGTYSNVYKARDRKSGKIVALKKVRFDTSEPESVKFMAREIIILKKLDHPNIIKLEGLATSRMHYSLYLVFDFMQSDLTKLINHTQGIRLTQPQIKCYMEQLLSGLEHCHERGILHRDIKGSNLLIDKNGILKIGDFGLANFYETKTKRPLTSRVVTLWYRAPELLLGSTNYSVGIDLWSAGCLLAEMFVGRPILPGRNEIEQLHKIFKLCGSPTEEYWKKVKPPTTFRPPQHKPCFGQIFPNLPHSAFPLLYTLLSVEPHLRGTASTALQNEFFTTSPLACGLSELPVFKVEDDGPAQSIDITRKRASKGKRVKKNREGYKKLLSNISENSKEEKQGESSNQSQDMGESSSNSFSLNMINNNINQSPPPSPTPFFKFRNINQFSKTEAHPNALKNIKNYPILLASITEAAKNYEDNRLSLNRRSISTIDFRNHHDLMDHKISKIFSFEDAS